MILTIVFIFLYRLQDSRLGRAWVAIREDELAAASMGINTVTTKLLAFAIGATTSGLAGVFYASKLGIVSPGPVRLHGLVHRAGHGRARRHGQHLGRGRRAPSSSTRSRRQGLKQLGSFVTSLHIPVIDIGPITSTWLDQLPQLPVPASTAWRSWLMMLLRPEGLFPSRRRRRELHEEVDEVAEFVAEEALER